MLNFKPINKITPCLISIFLLSFIVWFVGIDKIINDLILFNPWLIFAMLTIAILNCVITSLRFTLSSKYFGVNIPFRNAFKISVNDNFFSLFINSIFRKITNKCYLLKKNNATSKVTSSLIRFEGVLLFVISAIIFILSINPLLKNYQISFKAPYPSFVPICIAFSLSFIIICLRHSLLKKLFSYYAFHLKKVEFLKIATCTLMIQGLTLSIFLIASISLNVNTSIHLILAAAIISSFFAMLPISLNGWGVREIAAIFAFGAIGISPSNAFVMSILVGLCKTASILILFPLASKIKFIKIKEQLIPTTKINEKKKHSSKIKNIILLISTIFGICFCSSFIVDVNKKTGILINPSDIFAILSLIFVSCYCIKYRTSPSWAIPKFNLIILGFTILLILSFINGIQTVGITHWSLINKVLGWFVIMGYLGTGLLIRNYLGKQGIRYFIETILITSIVIIVIDLITRWSVNAGWLNMIGFPVNFRGFVANRNAFSFQSLVCLAIVTVYFQHYKKYFIYNAASIKKHIFYYFGISIYMAGICISFSRTGVASLILLIAFFFIINFINRKLLFINIILALCLFLFYTVSQNNVSQNTVSQNTVSQNTVSQNNVSQNNVSQIEPHTIIDTIKSRVSDKNSDNLRLNLLKEGLVMWLNHPVLGAGLGAFYENSNNLFGRKLVIHSTPLWIMAEFGIVGLLFFIYAFLWIIIKVFKSKLDVVNKYIIFMLFGILILFSALHEVLYQRIFWLVLGLYLAIPLKNNSIATKVK